MFSFYSPVSGQAGLFAQDFRTRLPSGIFYSQRVYDLFPQMATYTGTYAHSAQATWVFGSGMLSTGDNTDYLEWSVKVPAGTYVVKMLANKNTYAGIVDIYVDGATSQSFDLYAASAPNSLLTSSSFVLTEGSHTIKLQKNGKNASSSAWHVGIQHVQLVKQDAGSALAAPSNMPTIIDVPVVFADSHTNWNTLSMGTGYKFGIRRQSSGAQNDSVTYSFCAPAGNFTLALLYEGSDWFAGIFSISVDGNSIGTIDGLTKPANTLDTSLSGTLAYTGQHSITFTMATKNASSASYGGTLQHIQIWMTSISAAITQDTAPEIATLWPVFAEANTNWSTLTVGATYAYYHRQDSSGVQNDEITLSSNVLLRPGTYRLDILGTRATAAGIIHFRVDGAEVGTVDQYAAGTIQNAILTVSSVALSGFSPHSIVFRMATKNASASNYYGRLTLARLVRTGD